MGATVAGLGWGCQAGPCIHSQKRNVWFTAFSIMAELCDVSLLECLSVLILQMKS